MPNMSILYAGNYTHDYDMSEEEFELALKIGYLGTTPLTSIKDYETSRFEVYDLKGNPTGLCPLKGSKLRMKLNHKYYYIYTLGEYIGRRFAYEIKDNKTDFKSIPFRKHINTLEHYKVREKFLCSIGYKFRSKLDFKYELLAELDHRNDMLHLLGYKNFGDGENYIYRKIFNELIESYYIETLKEN